MTEQYAQRMAERLEAKLETISKGWPALIPSRPSAGLPGGGGKTTLITAGDHGDAPGWHVLGDHYNDVDAVTRLSNLKRTIVDVLNGWCHVVLDDLLLPPLHDAGKSRREVDEFLVSVLPSGQDVPGMCAFLLRHIEWLGGHEAASDMLDELAHLASAVRRHTAPSGPLYWRIGTCPLKVESDGAMVLCGGAVRYREDYRDEKGNAMLTCSRCGQSAVSDWWEDRMFDDPETRKMLTYDDVAMLARRILGRPVHKATVKMWASPSRGIIEPSGEVDEMGRVLFARDAVVYALDLWKRKAV